MVETAEENAYLNESNAYYVDTSNVIHINIDAGRTGIEIGDYAIEAALTHETGHAIAKNSPEAFGELKRYIKEKYYTEASWDAAVAERFAQYDNVLKKAAESSDKKDSPRFTWEKAEEEVVCNSLGELLADPEVMNELAAKHRNIFAKLWRAVKSFFEKLRERIRGSRKYSNKTFEQRIVEEAMEKKDRKLEKLFVSALRAANSAAKEQTAAEAKNDTAKKEKATESGEEAGDKSYSLTEKFKNRIDSWDGKTEGFSFVIGQTPDYLAKIVVNGKEIGYKQVRIDATKIIAIIESHPEMTKNVIKQLPDLLASPIVVLDSKTVKDRLVLLGEVYAKGKPVVMVLELSPSTKSGKAHYLDVIKIASAYTRRNTQNLINTSVIRYIDKNKSRVNDWLKVNRLQLPLPNSQSNSANIIIPDSSEKSNSFDENSSENSSNMSFSLSDKLDREALADAFYNLASTDEEREIVRKYRAELDNIDGKLSERRGLTLRLDVLTGKEGKDADSVKLRERIERLDEYIARHDSRLLELSAAKPFRDLMERYRKKSRRDRVNAAVTMTRGKYNKFIANYTHEKVYKKRDASDALERIAETEKIRRKTRDQLSDEIYAGLNGAGNPTERVEFIRTMADKILNVVLIEAKTDNPDYIAAEERLGYLKDYVGRLSFSEEMKKEIRHKYDKDGRRSFFGRWGNKQSGARGI